MAASRAGRWVRVVVAGALAVTLGAVPATTARAGASADPQVYPVSLPAAAAQAYDGQDLRIGRVLGRTSAYARHAVTYRGSGLTISGVLTIPRGTGPFPVVVLAHGYIDPDVYTTGRGFLREQDHLARQGFAVLHVDYRNHAASDDDLDNDVNIRLGYAADVVNAGLAVRASGDPRLDGDRLGLLGRSMGGAVALSALVIEPGLFDAAVLYSSVSSSAADNFNRWQRSDDALRREVDAGTLAPLDELGGPPDAAHAVASRAHPDGAPVVVMDEVVRVLGRLVPAVDVPGRARAATLDDVDLVRVWLSDFAAEAGVPDPRDDDALRARIGTGALALWLDPEGRRVALAGHAPPVTTPAGTVVRIGPVWTPPEHRRRGYAAALTSALAADLSADGSTVMLFADAANATSNGVYARLGFDVVDGWVGLALR